MYFNEQDSQGYTALIKAMFTRANIKIVKLLLDAGADPNIQNSIGGTALSLAAGYVDDEIVKLLLDAGADPNIRGVSGFTALMHAAPRSGNIETIKLLLNAGVDVNARSLLGMTALH